VTPADLAAVVADWCEAHGVGRVDLAIALLGADVAEAKTGPVVWITLDLARDFDGDTKKAGRAAALAVAAMRCDLEGR
jgi:hypothetical protein